jgi:hypothetical protein
MAKNPIQTDVFKFVALRPPVSVEKKKQETNYTSDSRKPEDTPVGKLVKSFDPKDGTKIPQLVRRFIDSNKYDLNYPQSDGDKTLSEIYDSVSSFTMDDFNADKLVKNIEKIVDVSLSKFLHDKERQNQLNNIWDRYYAFYILARTENQNLEFLTKNLRVFHLLQYVNTNQIEDFITLQNVITAKPVISSIYTDLPKPKITTEAPSVNKPATEKIKEYKNLWAQFVDVNRAIDEIKNVKFETKLTTETKNIVTPNKETGIEGKSKLISIKSNLSLNAKSYDNLHTNTKSVLSSLNLSEHGTQASEYLPKLQTTLEKINHSISNINDPVFLDQMPAEAKNIQGISSIIGKYGEYFHPHVPYIPPTNIRASIKPLGIGDLKVVKQKIKKYVAGEVAHIENVLRGEYKERKNRVLDRTEDIFTVTNETDEETTKDTQTTERFELKKESEKTVQEQMSIQAGVTVSGSYGMVTFGAHGDFAYGTSSQESNKSSSNFAREVIDKSVSKIQKKTKEERTTKKFHEVEEINTHGIDNKLQADHTIGIYRWVDKYYEAQIYNYGKRMMFEFIIPEPSTFYEYAQSHKPKKNIIPPIVPNKWIQDINGKWVTNGLITHKDINETNFQLYIRDYNVQGITLPPLPAKTISTSIAKDSMPIDGNPHSVNNKELIVPEGYISKLGVWFDCSAFFKNHPVVEITIGNKIFRPIENYGGVGVMANNHDNNSVPFHWYWPGNPIQIAVNLYDIASFTMNAYIYVERTNELYETWQIQTFEKIMAAYKAMQIEYDQKIAALEAQTGIAIEGQNPIINRQIEQTELKKQCVKMLMDTYQFGSFDAMKEGNPPDFDIFDAFEEGKTIQFFEQAFEWENLTYLFYPYFWGRKGNNSENWMHKINTYDTDPLFTKFLQSGSSRVLIPVHPAYNDAVMYFLENHGAIWKGGEPPRLNDPMFISIADELKNQTDDLANAVAEGDPWEVVLPTTLVYLQKDADLPTFNN